MSEPWRPRRELDAVSELSESDVAARLGLEGPGETAGMGAAAGAPAAVATNSLAGSAPRVAVRRSASRRRTLWWDSVTIVGGVVAALVALQYFGAPQLGPVAVASPTADETGVITGSLPVPATLPPPETLGPVVDPSLGFDATPTPIPVITLGPTPKETPSPSPSPTPGPGELTAFFTWAQLPGTLSVKFTDGSSGDIASRIWRFGDGTTSTAKNPTHTYAAGGTYNVRLRVIDPDGLFNVYIVPVTVAPLPGGTDPPVTDPPVTDPPVTDPPVTDPPVTDPPTEAPLPE